MDNENLRSALRQTNLQNESAEYLSKRDAPRLAEIELMRQRERALRNFAGSFPRAR